MKQKTWPWRSSASRFSAFPISKSNSKFTQHHNLTPIVDFGGLPDDVLMKIAATFSHPNLTSASLVCKSWNHALHPLREAMLFLRSGKRFKHGRAGFPPDPHKALDYFLNAAARGSTMAMVDAGLLYWEMGRKQDCLNFYLRAAHLGDPAAQCNLGIAYLQAEPAKVQEAAKWLLKSACTGYVRAQYQLALCLHQGRGVARNFKEAARWYLKAAESGYPRAMYNVSLCYSGGYGVHVDNRQAKKWMKKAADHGHSKAQFEHGLGLFVVYIGCVNVFPYLTSHYFIPCPICNVEVLNSDGESVLCQDGEMMKAVVYLELACRAGESPALHVKNVILQQISDSSRHRAMILADSWRALPSLR